jgi:putative phosphoribosyl transferase
VNEAIHFPGDTPIAIPSGQASLQGLLTLPARLSALVVLTHAGENPEARDDALAVVLQHAGIGTLTLDLLTHAEERFADIHHNVPLLAKRLLDALALIKQGMLLSELPTLPIGLCAAGDCSPVALRVAALRDHDIFAVVCRGGLIDLAGMLYLRSLAAPLLVLVSEEDERVTASNRRALRELACRQELKLLPAASPDSATALGFVARETVHWFFQHLPKLV